MLAVSATNGSDSAGSRGDLSKPFKTLAAAQAAASSGDCILVYPGTYNEGNLGKDGVNWHFFAGATINGTLDSAAQVAIWTDVASWNGGDGSNPHTSSPMNFRVTGEGVFTRSGFTPLSGHARCVIYVADPGSNITVKCKDISDTLGEASGVGSSSNPTGGILQIAGNLSVECETLSTIYNNAIWWHRGNGRLRVSKLTAGNNGMCIYNSGLETGDISIPDQNYDWFVDADLISGNSTYAILVANPTNSAIDALWIRAKEVICNFGAVRLVSSNGDKFYLQSQKLGVVNRAGITNNSPINAVTPSALVVQGSNINCWITVDKIAAGSGTGAAINYQQTGGQVHVRFNHMESLEGGANAMIVTAAGSSTSHTIGGSMVCNLGAGITVNGGTHVFENINVDTSTGTSKACISGTGADGATFKNLTLNSSSATAIAGTGIHVVDGVVTSNMAKAAGVTLTGNGRFVVAGTTVYDGGSINSQAVSFTNASLSFANLPTADPHVANRAWLNSGVFTVSAG